MDANHPSRYVGQNVDTVDQTHSMVLMGIASVGALVITVLHLLVG